MANDIPNHPERDRKKGRLRAFWDFFVLFSGISTASNLTRTQGRAVRNRGLFLFLKAADKKPDSGLDKR
jgi:hypothetical protein